MLCINIFFNRFIINLWNVFFFVGDSLFYLFCWDFGYDKSFFLLDFLLVIFSFLLVRLENFLFEYINKILVCLNDSFI